MSSSKINIKENIGNEKDRMSYVLFSRSELFSPLSRVSNIDDQSCPKSGHEGQTHISDIAIAKAVFLLKMGANDKMLFLNAIKHARIPKFWDLMGFTEDKALQILKENTSIPLLLKLALQKNVWIEYNSVDLEIAVSSDEDKDTLIEFIKGDDYKFCSLAFYSHAMQFEATHYSIYTSFPLEITSTKSDMSMGLALHDELEVEVIQVFGMFKEKYGMIARSCQSYLRFLENRAWGVNIKGPSTRVLFQSSLKGGNSIYLKEMHLTVDQSEAVASKLVKNYKWTLTTEKKHQEKYLRPPESTSFFILISANKAMQIKSLEKLRGVLSNVFNVPLSPTPTGILDLSFSITTPSWMKSAGKLTAIRDEFDSLAKCSTHGLSCMTDVDLSYNMLEWASDSMVLEFILSNCPKLQKLNLSNNELSGKHFCKWLEQIFERCPNLIIDLRDNKGFVVASVSSKYNSRIIKD